MRGPGISSALLCGFLVAKALAFWWKWLVEFEIKCLLRHFWCVESSSLEEVFFENL